jgi:three-Cys-motif partner protein
MKRKISRPDSSVNLSQVVSKLDIIGPWSETKLEIVQKYCKAYTTVLGKHRLTRIFIDAFSGAGLHLKKDSGEEVKGSPLRALEIEPPFDHYYFVELAPKKATTLKNLVGDRENVTILVGDCNVLLLEEVFPNVLWDHYRRGLCFLDPYGLDLNWEVIEAAGKMKSIELFINFPVYDMKLNALWKRSPEYMDERQLLRMDSFWGDRSWYNEVYDHDHDLFAKLERVGDASRVMATAFRDRLKSKANFKFVPEPVPMKNSSGGLLYYLFFASNNPVGNKIAKDVLDHYRYLQRQ